MKTKFFYFFLLHFFFVMSCSNENKGDVKKINFPVENQTQPQLNTVSNTCPMNWHSNSGVQRPIVIQGVQPQKEIDIEKVQTYNYSLHRQTYYNSPTSQKVKLNLIDPIPGKYGAKGIISFIPLKSSNEQFNLIYSGWDFDDGQFLSFSGDNVKKIVKDRIFSAQYTKFPFSQYNSPDPLLNRKIIAETDTVNDPTLYHMNDFSLVRVTENNWKLYFDTEMLDDLETSKLSQDPRDYRAPKKGEIGLTTLMMGYIETFDGGLTWNSAIDKNKESVRVTRKDRIYIKNLPDETYKINLGQGSVFYKNNIFHMYVNLSHHNCQINGNLKAYPEWSKAIPFCADHPTLPHRSVVGYATSEDGIDFNFQGYLKDINGTILPSFGAVGEQIKGKILIGTAFFNWMKPGQSPLPNDPNGFPYSEDPWNDPLRINLSWGIIDEQNPTKLKLFDDPSYPNSIGYNPLKLDWRGDGLLYRTDEFNLNFRGVNEKLYFDPSMQLLTIWQGNWNIQSPVIPGEDRTSYASALYLQKHIEFETPDGQVYKFQTAKQFDEMWLSESPTQNQNTTWITHDNNFDNPNGSKTKLGKFKIYDYDGEFICQTENVNVRPGDVWRFQPETCKSVINFVNLEDAEGYWVDVSEDPNFSYFWNQYTNINSILWSDLKQSSLSGDFSIPLCPLNTSIYYIRIVPVINGKLNRTKTQIGVVKNGQFFLESHQIPPSSPPPDNTNPEPSPVPSPSPAPSLPPDDNSFNPYELPIESVTNSQGYVVDISTNKKFKWFWNGFSSKLPISWNDINGTSFSKNNIKPIEPKIGVSYYGRSTPLINGSLDLKNQKTFVWIFNPQKNQPPADSPPKSTPDSDQSSKIKITWNEILNNNGYVLDMSDDKNFKWFWNASTFTNEIYWDEISGITFAKNKLKPVQPIMNKIYYFRFTPIINGQLDTNQTKYFEQILSK